MNSPAPYIADQGDLERLLREHQKICSQTASLREGFDLEFAAISGHCDAFAVALQSILANQGIESTLIVMERTRKKRRKIEEHNRLSHVILEVKLDDSQTVLVDMYGAQADERWEEEWIQPHRSEGEDHFSYHEVTRETLETLRQSLDQRSICPQHTALYEKTLSNVFQPRAEAQSGQTPSNAPIKRRPTP